MLSSVLIIAAGLAGTATTISATPPQYFNLTAISARNGRSTLECWQLATPIATSTEPGTSGVAIAQLGNVSSISYSILPPKYNGGLHNAPAAQYVAFVAGLAHVTIPDSKDEVWIEGGAHGLIVAADTVDVSKDGHVTEYPGDTPTIGLQIPFEDGIMPAHRILHRGPCRKCEMVTLTGDG